MSGRFEDWSVVVVGFAASGRAAASALVAEGARVRVTEARPEDELRTDDLSEAVRGAVDLRAGGHRPEDLADASLVVVSPGVPERADVLRWARRRRIPIWSELELGARLCRVPFVAVTGTNGKTTTTELVAGAMRAAGLRARACGNVGYPLSAAATVPTEPFDALAVECSSFQLRFVDAFRPRVSVLLNLAPDHLDWHGSFDAYAAAKARIFANQAGGDVHVGTQGDARSAAVSRRAPCAIRWFGEGVPDPAALGCVGVEGGEVLARDASGETVSLGAPDLAPRFLLDAAAAAAASVAFGLDDAAIRSALREFRPLPHRGERVAVVDGVAFVDDSKATNPHAALATLEGMQDVVLVAGGLAKGVDLTPLAEAASRLRGVVALGEAAPDLQRVFDGLTPVVTASSIDGAVLAAFGLARPDRTVVLAPACASQDMFTDYQERGERFAAAARALVGRIGRVHADRS